MTSYKLFLVSMAFMFLTTVSSQNVRLKPCELRSNKEVNKIVRSMITAGNFTSPTLASNFNFTSNMKLEVQNYRSFCPSERTAVARGMRQLCREKLFLNVDLTREPAAIYEAKCSLSGGLSHPCNLFAAGRTRQKRNILARNFTCVNRFGVVHVRHRLCAKSGNRRLSDVFQPSYMLVRTGCQMKYL